jgi:hypothetical protein
MPRTSPYRIELTDDERARLEVLARSYSSPHRDVVRAKVVLLAASGAYFLTTFLDSPPITTTSENGA